MKNFLILKFGLIPIILCLTGFSAKDVGKDLSADTASHNNCYEIHYVSGHITWGFVKYTVKNHCRETITVKVKFSEYSDLFNKYYELFTVTKTVRGGQRELLHTFGDGYYPEDIKVEVVDVW